MAATRADIAGWFDAGRRRKATHLIVMCDTFDHDDYPVYAMSAAEAKHKLAEVFAGRDNMQRVMEVYDLSLNKAMQLAEHRAMHLPG